MEVNSIIYAYVYSILWEVFFQIPFSHPSPLPVPVPVKIVKLQKKWYPFFLTESRITVEYLLNRQYS